MIGLLNIGSLVLGLVAWSLPVICLMSLYRKSNNHYALFSFFSMTACATALFFQMIYAHHLVRIGDWSALMDTSSAVVFVSSMLLTFTLILNLMTYRVYRKAKKQ